ncbi:MAG: hypothetical protein JXR63_03985 [Spirochaetales bacterium]|nr:hypothetical protein [Spirochaetales bacterium]
MEKRFLNRIGIRILIFNVLLVFFPIAVMLYLDTYEKQLLSALEDSLSQQAIVAAAALTDNLSGADKLVRTMERKHFSRIRIVLREGGVLADSSVVEVVRTAEVLSEAGRSAYDVSGAHSGTNEVDEQKRVNNSFLYRLGRLPFRVINMFKKPEAQEIEAKKESSQELLARRDVRTALEGRYGSSTVISSSQNAVILSSAYPIYSGGNVAGVVLVSQSTARIMQNLYQIRFDLFKIFLYTLLVAVIISVIVSQTISRPIRKLKKQSSGILNKSGIPVGNFDLPWIHDEIRDLAQHLNVMSDKVRTSMEELKAFSADTAHELKNPLASIRAANEILSESVCTEEKRFSDHIAREVVRMEYLISRLRDLTSIGSGMMSEEWVQLDLAQELVRTESWFKLKWGEMPFLLTIEKRGLCVRMPQQRFEQIVENLLENAAGFTDAHRGVAVKLSESGGFACIEVADFGKGIRAEDLPRIFDRFFTTRRGSGDAAGHCGLGLAVAAGIVEEVGGRIAAENARGGGAVFRVWLPFGISREGLKW